MLEHSRSSPSAPTLLGHGGTCPPLLQMAGHVGEPCVEKQQTKKKLTKLYWPSWKRSPKRLIINKVEGHDKIFFRRFVWLSNSLQRHWSSSRPIVCPTRPRTKEHPCWLGRGTPPQSGRIHPVMRVQHIPDHLVGCCQLSCSDCLARRSFQIKNLQLCKTPSRPIWETCPLATESVSTHLSVQNDWGPMVPWTPGRRLRQEILPWYLWDGGVLQFCLELFTDKTVTAKQVDLWNTSINIIIGYIVSLSALLNSFLAWKVPFQTNFQTWPLLRQLLPHRSDKSATLVCIFYVLIFLHC